jgi:hypothetical protein
MEHGIGGSTKKRQKCSIVVDSRHIKSRVSQIELSGHTVQNESSSSDGEFGGSGKVMGLWAQPICVRGIPPHVAARMVEAAPFLVGSTHAVYDAQFFHKQLGLCCRGLLVEEISTKECPDHLWASTWPLHEDGQTARARILGCRNVALKVEFLKLYKKVYGQKPDNGCFMQKFVCTATLLIISKKDMNFVEFATKLTEAHIHKAKDNP